MTRKLQMATRDIKLNPRVPTKLMEMTPRLMAYRKRYIEFSVDYYYIGYLEQTYFVFVIIIIISSVYVYVYKCKLEIQIHFTSL